MKTKTIVSALAAAVTLFSAPALLAHEGHDKDAPKKEEEPAKKEGVKPYKLDTCVVSGDKLDEMGKPVSFEYKGQEIKLCCKDCRKDFNKDPDKYLKKLEGK